MLERKLPKTQVMSLLACQQAGAEKQKYSKIIIPECFCRESLAKDEKIPAQKNAGMTG
jgi:hypothetical protein